MGSSTSKINELPVEEQKILQKMAITLDIDLLFELSVETREKIKVFTKENQDRFQNKALYTLLNNYYRGQVVFPDYILGPTMLSKLTSADKTIYIFGETHVEYSENI